MRAGARLQAMVLSPSEELELRRLLEKPASAEDDWEAVGGSMNDSAKRRMFGDCEAHGHGPARAMPMTPEAVLGLSSSAAVRAPMTPEVAFRETISIPKDGGLQMPMEPGDEVTVIPKGFNGMDRWMMPLPMWSDERI